jgi:hypothetical protein
VCGYRTRWIGVRRSEAAQYPLFYLIGILVHTDNLPARCDIYRTPRPTEFAEGDRANGQYRCSIVDSLLLLRQAIEGNRLTQSYLSGERDGPRYTQR